MKKTLFLLPLILLSHLILLVFLQFAAWPEMTLWPYLVNQGWLPYRDIAMAHNPLLIFILAGYYKLFGLSLLNLKIFTWVLILITDTLLYCLIVKLLKNHKTALFSLIFYIIWQVFFEGNGLWFDLVLAPLALLVFYFIWEKKFFWAGIMLGLAILVKQTAVWFVIPLIGEIWVIGEFRVKNIFRLVTGGIIPLAGLAIYLLLTGTLNDFYFWAIKFGSFYLPSAFGQVELPTFRQLLQLVVPFAFLLPAIYMVYRKKENWPLIFSLVLWFIFASLGVYPRWSLFHFQPALPFLAIIFGVLLSNFVILSEAKDLKRDSSAFGLRMTKILIVVVVILGTIYLQSRFYRLNWQKPTRFFEKETLEMASWLKNNTRIGQKIFILNSWDHLYALSNTLPATDPWVPTLPWYLEYPGIQDKIVADLTKGKPALVVFEPYAESGLGSYKPAKIDKFIRENYTLKEIIGNRFQILESK